MLNPFIVLLAYTGGMLLMMVSSYWRLVVCACLVSGFVALAEAQTPFIPNVPDTSRVIQFSDVVVRSEIATSLPGTVIEGPVGQGFSGSGEAQDAIFTDLVRVEDGTQRFLATTLAGNVHVLNRDGQIQTTVEAPLLNATQTGNSATFNFRFGFNSIALHPDFANPGTFGFGKAYGVASQDVDLAVTPTFDAFDSNGDAPGGGFNHDSVLFEYDLSEIVGNAGQNSVTTTTAPRELLRVRQPGPSHNGFDIDFSSDGQLYFSVGDGTANSFADDSGLRLQEAQNLESVYGKLLRINPDPNAAGSTTAANGQYSVSDSNPFVGQTARSGAAALPEVYANGFRSPFRISVNPENEEEVFLGDVGGGNREEINRVVAGGNYGWGIREGSDPLNQSFINVLVDGEVVDGQVTLIGPEFEYARTNVFGTRGISGLDFEAGGISIIAGELYQGSLFEGLSGQFIGAELGGFFGGNSLSRVFFGDPDDDLLNASQEVSSFVISELSDEFDNEANGIQGLPNLITGVFEGFNGEIFVIGLDGTALPGVDEGANGEFNPGNLVIARLLPDELPGDFNLDGAVNAADYVASRDGVGGDLAPFVDNFGLAFFSAGSPPAVSSAATTVPEPSAGVLGLMCAWGLVARGRK